MHRCTSLLPVIDFYPAHLITSLRTSDSLSDNESYFFAELKRLKRIIDLLNEGKELFIILDEILKGTNSADKQKGSFDLIRQFMNLRANGIIATHDLLLGELTKQFPDEIRNYCFEADIKNNELSFSYKLREGIAQNMNACFLMKKWELPYKIKLHYLLAGYYKEKKAEQDSYFIFHYLHRLRLITDFKNVKRFS